MNKTQAIATIRSGKIFSCEFLKKDGSNRKLVGRTGVKSHLKKGKKAYVAEDMGLITVYDFGVKDYRAVNVQTLHKVNGKKVS